MTDGIGDGRSLGTAGQHNESLFKSDESRKLQVMTVDPFGDPVEARVGERAPQLDLTDPNYAGPVRIMSNESRTIYKGPAEPKLKILKRPEANSAAQQANRKQELQVQQRNTQKTLEQREADYAEARSRILGPSQESPKPATTTTKPNGKKSEGSSCPHPKKMSNSEVRPKGPDGTRGFQSRR